jgi:predicted restriction endonuclease
MRNGLKFGLSEEAYRLLCTNTANAATLATLLAAKIVPPSMQADLLDVVGIDASPALSLECLPFAGSSVSPALIERAIRYVSTLKRDPAFTRKVRAAYAESCAICAVAPRLERKLFGLEAAHIRWANAGGPDEVRNGIFLCRMHHHALDRGAIRINESMRLELSPKLTRSPETDLLFARFEGKEIRLPKHASDHPHIAMLRWHWTEVFLP